MTTKAETIVLLSRAIDRTGNITDSVKSAPGSGSKYPIVERSSSHPDTNDLNTWEKTILLIKKNAQPE
jgi:hypothetical protein